MAELEPLDRAVALLDEAVVEAAPRPALQAALHLRLAGDGPRDPRLDVVGRSCARRAPAGRRAGRRRASSRRAVRRSPCFRFDRGDEDAPRLAERAYELAVGCDDREQLRTASWALGHILTWSVSTDQGPRAPRGAVRGGAAHRTSGQRRVRSGTCPSSSYGRAAGRSPPSTPSGRSRSASQYGTSACPELLSRRAGRGSSR